MKSTIRSIAVHFSALAVSLFVLAGCQREELAGHDVLPVKEGVVNFAPSIGGIVSGVKSVYSEDSSAAVPAQSLALTSEDGKYTIPMDLSVTGMEACVGTKAALINGNGGITDAEFAEVVGNTFWVSAWDETPAQIIPDKVMPDFTTEDGKYQKVMYRTKDVADETLSKPYWMTMQPMPGLNDGVTTYGPADDEYIWKSGETKTFYAYANVPGTGVSMQVASSGQTMTYTVPATAAAQTDILLGFYKGNGKSGATGSEKMTGTAGITFEHPLTAVKFLYGKIEDNLKIKSISLKGVAASGTAKMNSAGSISWEVADFDFTVKQEDASGLSVDTGSKLIGEPFILIPQNLVVNNVIVTVTFTDDTVVKATINTETWQAGMTNTYTLGYMKVTPEAVDLGLSVLWATFNVGANKPEENGDYFAWGATEPWYEPGHAKNPTGYWKPGKDGGYSWKNTPYQTSDATTETDTKWSKYLFGNSSKADPSATEEDIAKSVLDLEDDAANVNWGGTWRMPTAAEMEELLNNTKKTIGNYKGTSGYYFTSKITGYTDKSIFIPFAGYYSETNYSRSGVLYWTSSLYGVDKVHYAFKLMGTSSPIMKNEYRYMGGSVRPVKDKFTE